MRFYHLGTAGGRSGLLETLRARELDGLVLISVMDRGVIDEWRGIWSGPTVLADHYFPELALTGVIDDSEDGARQATEHLLSLGHRRIAYVDMHDPSGNPWRYAGYSKALRGAGIEPDEELRIFTHDEVKQAEGAGRQLLSLPEPPTAALAFNNKRAWGLWSAVEERGLKVGRDFGLVGFGESAGGTGFSGGLSSVRVDLREVGLAAAREVDNLIAGRARPGKLVKIPMELVVRESSRNARPAPTPGEQEERP